MGQLDVYPLEDISIITIMAGPVSTYLSEEVEVSIESIVAYIYSANIVKTKKRIKLVAIINTTGDIVGAIYKSYDFLNILKAPFLQIQKNLEDKIMWQDPILSQWEGAVDRQNLQKLDNKYSW